MSKEESVIQPFGSLSASRLGLSEQVRHQSVAALNRLLAHTMAMRDLYKKSHWQTSGATFYELHLLFDKHYGEQVEIMDTLAERVQTLGGVTLALAHDVAEETRIARAPRGRESVPAQLRRLVEAHEFVLGEARPLARAAARACRRSCAACSRRMSSCSGRHGHWHTRRRRRVMTAPTT